MGPKFIFAVLAAVLCLTSVRQPAAADSPGRVIGLGGVILVSKDPKALAAWYHEMLGVSVESWGGVILKYDATTHPPYAVWNPVTAGSSELEGSQRGLMLNLTVDDLDALVAHLQSKGVTILKREADSYGKFASIVDPDGTKIELWQPLHAGTP
jgi:predicted enzyme related to lactoylglutathione lyase